MLGIGLGAFVDGIEQGMNLRDRVDERGRTDAARQAVEGIEADTQKAFSAEVEAGKADPDQYDKFWTTYALPKLAAERRKAGDIKGALALQEWGESEAAKEGGRLFSGAMIKAQTGDAAGALEDAIAASKVKGYLDADIEVIGQEPIQDAEGNLIGFRLSMKGADGEETQQDVAVADVPRLISTFVNPEAAWESQVSTRAKGAERQAGLEDYETKKKIDAKYKDGDGDSAKRRTDAIKSLRERLDGGLVGDDPSFDDLSPDEQEKLIQQELELQTGKPAAAAQPGAARPAPGKVLVDENTGQVVTPSQAPAETPPAPAAPSAPVPATANRRPVADANGAAAQPAAATVGSNGRAQAVSEAATLIQQGGDPEAIARRLTAAGVPPAEWPGQLVMAPGLMQ